MNDSSWRRKICGGTRIRRCAKGDRNPDEAVRILLRCALRPEGTRHMEEAKRLVNQHVYAMAESNLAQTALKTRNIFVADPERRECWKKS